MSQTPGNKTRGRGRTLTVAAAFLATLTIGLLAFQGTPANAVTPQQKYDRAQSKLADIAGSVDQLKQQVAADNAKVDSMLGELSGLRETAAALESELAAKQEKLDTIENRLAAEREHLKEVRARLRRALDVLSKQLVALYMAGSPDMSELVLTATSWSDLVSSTEYAESIQDRDESVITRVSDLRDEITGMVETMKGQEKKLQAARDEIAVEEQAAVAARDEAEARRATFLASRDARNQRITALQAQAGDIEGNLPDLSVDPASSSATSNGAPAAPPPTTSGGSATLGSDGLASAPASAPQAVKDVIAAANAIVGTPYVWGGGHGSFESSGYDCSGAVSYALNGGGLISSPLDSTGLTTWGEPGEGNWITVYGNSGHAFAIIAGLRWDTSGTGGSGPKWSTDTSYQDTSAFTARHPSGL